MAILNPICTDQTTGLSRTFKTGDIASISNVDSSAGLIIGGATATSIAIGRAAIVTTVRGGLIGGAASGTTNDGDFRFGDGTSELSFSASTNILSLLGAAATITRGTAASDVATTALTITAQNYFPTATTNITGGDLIIGPGTGAKLLTVVDYTIAAANNNTVEVVVDGLLTVLTAGTDFSAITSNDVTATNIATAIDGITGVNASATGAVVAVLRDPGTYTLDLDESGTGTPFTFDVANDGRAVLANNLTVGVPTSMVTVFDFTSTSGVTLDVFVDGVLTVLTPGVDFTAATSNDATATSLASAINGVTGVSATAFRNIVTTRPDAGVRSVELDEHGSMMTTTSRNPSAESGGDLHCSDGVGTLSWNANIQEFYVGMPTSRGILYDGGSWIDANNGFLSVLTGGVGTPLGVDPHDTAVRISGSGYVRIGTDDTGGSGSAADWGDLSAGVNGGFELFWDASAGNLAVENITTAGTLTGPSMVMNRATLGDASANLIKIDNGGTIFTSTGANVQLGPVYYDPNTGQKIRFGASIMIDGDGVVNTINGDDGANPRTEALFKLTVDGTRNLATDGPITANNLTTGSVTLRGFLASAPTVQETVTDNGAGAFPVSTLLPSGGTITYATGATTGTTASLVATSELVAAYLVDNTAGEALTPRGGNGTGTAAGGPLNCKGGAGGATGAGGDISLISGAGGATSGGAGSIDISVGATVSGTPGTVTVNSLPLPTVLGQATGVNLDAVSTDVLYTVPTGRSAVITSVAVRLTAATAAAGDSIVSVGTNASSYDNIITSSTLTGLDALTETFVIVTGGLIHTAAAAEVVTFNITTADTGTTATAAVELIGYLL
jgi:hypothetical protein